MPEINREDLLLETGFTLRYRGDDTVGFGTVTRAVVGQRSAVLTIVRESEQGARAKVDIQELQHEHIPEADRPNRYHLGEARPITPEEAQTYLGELQLRAHDTQSPLQTQIALLIASMGVLEAAQQQSQSALTIPQAVL